MATLASPKNWTLITYDVDTWTDLVNELSVISTVLITNPSVGPANVSLRLKSSTAIILPNVELAAGESITLEARSLSIPTGDGLQIFASAIGLNFIASGAGI